jgi:hypothetical protein
MKIGNVWIYHNTTTTPYYTNQYSRSTIDSSIIYNGHKYYRFRSECRYISGYPPCSGTTYSFLRIDSLTGIIYQFIQGINHCPGLLNLLKSDSLQARLHDTVVNCSFDDIYFWVCADTSNQTVFGYSTPVKYFVCDYFEHYYTEKYAKNIGRYDLYGGGVNGSMHNYLVGCVINNIVYGDTAFITGIKIVSSKIPETFSLSQNFPNPFNPKSNIKFQIAKSCEVKLVVFDALGREITTLVNEQLQPGTYEVEWNGSKYPSGVYFYKLITSGYSETKKMVLIK